MSLAEKLGIAIGAALVLAVIVVVVGAKYRRVGRATGQAGSVATWTAAVLVTGLAVALFPAALDDSGWFAIVLVGVPVVGAAVAVIAYLRGRWVGAATWVAAGVIIVWGVITGLGLGGYFLPLGIVMLAAAALSSSAARQREPLQGNSHHC